MIRPYRPGDADLFLALNEFCVPEVGSIDLERLQLLSRSAAMFQVVEQDGALVGGLIGLIEGATDYPSPNYRWFSERHARFAYVDRVLFAPAARGQGLGKQLYQLFADWALAERIPVLCAEVNTIPDNPGSHRFHLREGFAEVARLRPYSPDAEVAMYERQLL
ncbi:MAG: GNAT family N-acetyltransferase [Burkholderiaceae bacterium]